MRPQAAIAPLLIALLPVCAAAQGVQVYGRVVLFANDVRTEGQSGVRELRDHASRLGFRGTEDLGGDLKASFGLEMGLAADSGTSTEPQYRHSYVGLGSSRWGALAAGRLDSATPAGSPIYTPVTKTVEFVGYDAGATAISTSMLNSRNRTSNAIGYATPTIGGFTFRARGYLRGAGTATEAEDDAKSLDLGVDYAAGPLYLSASYGKDRRSGGLSDDEFDDKWQATARYEFGPVAPYALIGRDRYDASAGRRGKVDYWLAGVVWTGGPHKAMVNVMRRDVQASPSGERRRWQAGYVYSLSKRTQVQALVDRDGVDSSRDEVRVTVFGMGLRHDF